MFRHGATCLKSRVHRSEATKIPLIFTKTITSQQSMRMYSSIQLWCLAQGIYDFTEPHCNMKWNGKHLFCFLMLFELRGQKCSHVVPDGKKTKKKNTQNPSGNETVSQCRLAAANIAKTGEQSVVYSSVSFFESSTKIRRSIFFLFLILNFRQNGSILHVGLSPRYLKAPQKNNQNLVLVPVPFNKASLLDSLSPSGG